MPTPDPTTRAPATLQRTGAELGSGLILAQVFAAFAPEQWTANQLAAVVSLITAAVPVVATILRNIVKSDPTWSKILIGSIVIVSTMTVACGGTWFAVKASWQEPRTRQECMARIQSDSETRQLVCEAARQLRGKTKDEAADFCVGGNILVTREAQYGCSSYPDQVEPE